MDEWRMPQQPHRMIAGGVGPVLGYHSMRSRSAPYPTAHPMVDMKQAYQYPPNPASTPSNPLSPTAPTTTAASPMPSTTPILSKADSNDPTSSTSDDVSVLTPTPDVYTSNNPTVSYSPAQMDQIQQQQQQQQQQQRSMPTKSSIGPMMSYNAGQQQMMVARSRSMPYPMPPPPSHHHAHPHHHSPMYPPPPGQVCQCAQHMHSHSSHYPMHPAQHPMYYQQQQQEAWYRYQQQQAAWRQHHMQQQQQQQRLQSHPQPVPIQQSYEAILAENTSTTKLKASKSKAKKKPSNTSSLDDEAPMKYQPMPLPTMNPALSLQQQQHQQQQRVGIPPPHAAYYQAVYSAPNTYVPAQQLPPPPSLSSSSLPASQEHALYAQTSPQTLSHPQSQIFTSPLSNPSTPHQLHGNGEFNGTNEFGVPYHHGAPGSVNSLTDALCPSGEVTDRQMTPGPPSVGTPRVAAHQYSFPHTPLTPQTINSQSMNPHTPVMMPPTPNPLSAPPTPLTRPRSSSEQAQSVGNHFHQYEQNKSVSNVDDLAAYLKDPTDVYLADDVSPNFFDEIDALADTYLGQQANAAPQATVDQNSAEDILLNFLCGDELTS